MRPVIALASAALLVYLPTSVNAQDRFRYFAEATNRMIQVAADPRATIEATTGAATQACQALGTLLSDEVFWADLDRTRRLAQDARPESEPLRHELWLFADFLVRERAVLTRVGLAEWAVDYTLVAAGGVREGVTSDWSPQLIRTQVQALRDQLCIAATELARLQDAASRRRRLGGWALGLGGTALHRWGCNCGRTYWGRDRCLGRTWQRSSRNCTRA